MLYVGYSLILMMFLKTWPLVHCVLKYYYGPHDYFSTVVQPPKAFHVQHTVFILRYEYLDEG